MLRTRWRCSNRWRRPRVDTATAGASAAGASLTRRSAQRDVADVAALDASGALDDITTEWMSDNAGVPEITLE